MKKIQKNKKSLSVEEKWDEYKKNIGGNKEWASELRKSWEELSKLGLNPKKKEFDLKSLSKQQFKNKKSEISQELDVIREYMEYLYNFIKGNDYIISFLNKEKYILEIMGDKEIKNKFKNRFNYKIGIKWDEYKVGTNASSLSLKTEKPIQLMGSEHFCEKLYDLGCSASPIRDIEGNVIGVLKITGLIPEVNLHTLGMVVTSTKAISNELKQKELNKKLKNKNKLEKAIFQSISEGILYVDKNGIIKFMNKTGADILNVDKNEVIGEYVENIVDFRPVILEVLESGEGYEDKEFYLKSHGELLHFVKTTKVLKDAKGNMRGVLDTFRELKRIKKMVNDMTGATAKFLFEDIIGQSQAIKISKEKAKRAAKSNSNVLIEGDTGTGKEMFAQAIHKESSREEGPFIAINCAALPPQLIESELFGYVEGSFTGAKKGGRPGKFEMANGGTIFLDEIGELPLNMQAKLLRVLQEKKIVRIGGNEYIPVDVRVIAATNKKLIKEIEKSNFREDLYYRLNVLNISLPTLKDRNNDIVLLANNFLDRISSKLGKDIKGFSSEVKEYLLNYEWPGNVRELENLVEKMVNYCDSEVINMNIMKHFTYKDECIEKETNKCSTKFRKIKSMEETKKDHIKEVVGYCNGNISEAANLLKVSRKTIYQWLD